MSHRPLLALLLVVLLLVPACPLSTQAAEPVLNDAYASGWSTVAPGQLAVLDHNLGGDDPALYAVDLMMLDERPLCLGVHIGAYGGMLKGGDRIGMHWQNLTANQIGISRGLQDPLAAQYLLRIWQPAPPQYDSGWVAIAAGTSLALTHDLGGDPSDYVASLKFRNPAGGMGINQYAFGGMAGDTWTIGGAFAHLDDERVVLTRMANDEQAAEMRILIYAEPPGGAPAYDSGWVDLQHNAAQPLNHGLATAPGQLVVRMSQRSTTHGINNRAMGGMELGHFFYGAGWQNLTENGVSLFRLAHDPYAEQARVRIWRFAEPCSPELLSPADGAVMDNGCIAGSDERWWSFAWSTCRRATRYQLLVNGPNSTSPLIDQSNLTTTTYDDRAPGFIAEDNLLGWTWQVRAMVDGAWGPWSTAGTFDVEPRDTDCPPTMIYLPAVTSP